MQHGFRPKCSIWSALIPKFNKYKKWLDDKTDTDVTYFDFAKAFDAVNKEALLTKLEANGLGFYGLEIS